MYVSDHQLRNNTWLLALAQALAGANTVVIYATGSIVGNMLAPTPFLATLPISILVVGMALSILPIGAISRHFGRKTAFLLGTGLGVVTGLLSFVAIVEDCFWCFCLATFFGGIYAAVVLTYRFAATDGVAPEKRAKALSWVMAGGVLAGIIGPQLVTLTMYQWPIHIFAATFIFQALVALLSAFFLLGVKLPKPTENEKRSGRPLLQVIKQPRFVVAVACGAASYMVMNFLMTAAPLAMNLCGLSQESSNLGVQWHVIAMYGPSFFTGSLITRFGADRVVMSGLLLTAISAAVGLGGVDVTQFWWMLIILGIGWNFGFLGASAMVLECHRPEEKTQVQAFNDFIIFGLMAVGSFSSGGLLSVYGWDTVLKVSVVPIMLAFIVYLVFRTKRTGNIVI